jgi:ribosomal-protein-serine acetyltransferase
MSCQTVNEETELRLLDLRHSAELFNLFEANREHLRQWHPWVDLMRSAAIVEKTIMAWQQQYANRQGYHAGIWFKEQFCGMISYLNVDCSNRWTSLFYWLDSAHQGQGIMTACCRAMVAHGFESWKFNRITIECATQNARSRAIPERLGFKLEGIVRGIEWLHGQYVDHAMYGLLHSEYVGDNSVNAVHFTGLSVARGRPSFRPG